MSRDSAFMYKGKDTDAHTVGQAAGVQAVFKGRVMQRGERLEISAELVDARQQPHLGPAIQFATRRTSSPCRVSLRKR